MQSWILDKDFYKSASYLDRNRLQANIYENIHILASLIDVNDKLVNPKRSVKNHPASKLWVGYESELLSYINKHLLYWFYVGYESEINWENYWILNEYLGCKKLIEKIPSWITDELIMTHRSVLIQKEIEREIDLEVKKGQFISVNYYYDFTRTPAENKTRRSKNYLYLEKINKKIAANYHYRRLWPDCPTNLSMRYDWRK